MTTTASSTPTLASYPNTPTTPARRLSAATKKRREQRNVDINNRRLSMFERSRFTEPESYNQNELSIATLTNEMHPLFKPQMWDLRHLPGTEFLDNYFTIAQACRLASAILQSGLLDHFFHVLLFDFTNLRALQGRQFEFTEAAFATPLTAAQKQRVQRRLRQIAERRWVSYVFQKGIDQGAHTEPLRCQKTEPAHEQGRKSIVKISAKMFTALARADDVGDIPSQLYHRFNLAITLVHELSHVCRNLREARHGYPEPFMRPDALVAEIGFELEDFLFEGYLDRMFAEPDKHCYTHDGKVSELTGILTLIEWPCRRVVQSYKKNGFCVRERISVDNLREHDVAWRVEISFLQRFFRDEFWQQNPDAAGMQPPKLRGHCFKAVGEFHFPVACRSHEAAPNCIPAGYGRVKKTGDVGRAWWAEALTANPRKPRTSRPAATNAFAAIHKVAGGRIKKVYKAKLSGTELRLLVVKPRTSIVIEQRLQGRTPTEAAPHRRPTWPPSSPMESIITPSHVCFDFRIQPAPGPPGIAAPTAGSSAPQALRKGRKKTSSNAVPTRRSTRNKTNTSSSPPAATSTQASTGTSPAKSGSKSPNKSGKGTIESPAKKSSTSSKTGGIRKSRSKSPSRSKSSPGEKAKTAMLDAANSELDSSLDIGDTTGDTSLDIGDTTGDSSLDASAASPPDADSTSKSSRPRRSTRFAKK